MSLGTLANARALSSIAASPVSRTYALICFLVAFVTGTLAGPGIAAAQPPVGKTTAPTANASDAGAPSVDAIDPTLLRAQQILALTEGTLDPRIDPTDLLIFDLSDPVFTGPSGERLAKLLRAEPAEPPATPPEPPSLEGLEPAAALEAALAAFANLSSTKRSEVLAAHAEKRAAAQTDSDSTAKLAEQLTKTTLHAAQLAAYLDGELDPSVTPDPLTRLDLRGLDETGASPSLSMAWHEDENAPTPPQKNADVDALRAAQSRLDGLRRRYVQLSDEARGKLRVTHDESVVAAAQALLIPDEELETAQVISEAESEADAAALAREAALETARQAKTEAKRILAEEHARLLGVKEAQARYEAELNGRKAARSENNDKALEWSRRVSELADSAKFGDELSAEADQLYEGIRADLSELRRRLRQELKRLRRAGADVPSVGEGLDRDLAADVDRGILIELRAELLAREEVLADLETSIGWELAQALRDDVVGLNQTRLRLLEMSSSSLRSSVTGFGSSGVDQVKREFDQISVELGFLVLKLPLYTRDFGTKLQESTLALLIGGAQFLLAFAVYIWWRRRGGEMLDRAHAHLRDRQPTTPVYRVGSTLTWYLKRTRRPLELLLILWVLFALIGDLGELREFNLLWIIALWVLLGLAVILLVDALAARETLYSADVRDNSKLRIHSLRVVGLNVIAVGLILSLTAALVGKGAIYSWVISTCWILSFPVAVYLVHKWRPICFELIEQRPEQGPFTTWVSSRKTGLASFPAATAAAVYLLAAGCSAWVMRQLSGFEATRRLLAYLFRREVAKQAAATEADGRYSPVSAEVYDHFSPEVVPGDLLADVASPQLEKVAGQAASSNPTLSAIIGERGAGKSVFLHRLAARVGDDRVDVLPCPEEGVAALMAAIAKLAGKPKARGPELRAALRELGSHVIAIDDLQRLVVPAVNGLRGLDEFTKFAREVGGDISWVVTIGSAAWHYVKRARGDRVFFEQVVALPRWKEDELGRLIKGQCEKAKIDPSFKGLVVPRQADAPLPNEGDRTEAGYYRLLWDFSNGNPAVALHAFRESLFVTTGGETVVRLFKEPPPEQIEDLSMPVLFVLRTTVQLELAMAFEVEAATQLPRADVDDALRFCLSRGYLEPYQGGVRLTWPWYRTITTVLQRQHLLPAL